MRFRNNGKERLTSEKNVNGSNSRYTQKPVCAGIYKYVLTVWTNSGDSLFFLEMRIRFGIIQRKTALPWRNWLVIISRAMIRFLLLFFFVYFRRRWSRSRRHFSFPSWFGHHLPLLITVYLVRLRIAQLCNLNLEWNGDVIRDSDLSFNWLWRGLLFWWEFQSVKWRVVCWFSWCQSFISYADHFMFYLQYTCAWYSDTLSWILP